MTIPGWLLDIFAGVAVRGPYAPQQVYRSARTDGQAGEAGRRWPPAVAKGCRVALGVTGAFFLIIMI